MNFEKSRELFAEASKVLPGGVNSPVRAFRGVGGNPLFIERGEGAYVYDADGNRFIDYVLSWGPLILGHAHPDIVEAITAQAKLGSSFGAPTALETEMAHLLIKALPSMEMVRLVSSGTEATMSALRVARGYTGRNKILKFSGCYHGHADFLLVHAGSGVATLGLPDSPGVTPANSADTLVAEYNDLDGVEAVFKANPDQIAAVIVEPVAGNMGLVLPKEGFLQGLREITQREGAVLIFDEVMNGFRIGGVSGSQGHFGIKPDMTTLGKVIGGGLPVGAYGGSYEIMKHVAPLGTVYQAGTLSGNPLAMAAGIAVLKKLMEPGFYEGIEVKAARLEAGMVAACKESPVPVYFKRIGTKFGLFFTDHEVTDYPSAKTADTKAYARFFWGLIERGVYFAPSQFEAGFLSSAHTEEQIDLTLQAVRESFAALA
ncbi:MAG: glutamate-1-semialdehyde 2,1-aminomutase [Chloroflexota bacterium]|nr:glutamate-1-semialdehyde 2,1-aminomutase [Chloroflexota bacterium]